MEPLLQFRIAEAVGCLTALRSFGGADVKILHREEGRRFWLGRRRRVSDLSAFHVELVFKFYPVIVER